MTMILEPNEKRDIESNIEEIKEDYKSLNRALFLLNYNANSLFDIEKISLKYIKKHYINELIKQKESHPLYTILLDELKEVKEYNVNNWDFETFLEQSRDEINLILNENKVNSYKNIFSRNLLKAIRNYTINYLQNKGITLPV